MSGRGIIVDAEKATAPIAVMALPTPLVQPGINRFGVVRRVMEATKGQRQVIASACGQFRTRSSNQLPGRRGWAPWASCIDQLATTSTQACALLADAVALLEARAVHLAATGRRVWQPSPQMPALVVIVNEYAELADHGPDAITDAD